MMDAKDQHRSCSPMFCESARKQHEAADADLAVVNAVISAAIRWRDVASGKLTVPPWAYLDVEQELGDAVQAKRGGGSG